MTPFHRLALAARNAAFKNDTLKPKDIDTVLKESTNKLMLWVTLRGDRIDFARFYVPLLLDGKTEIKPSFVQNERTALRAEGGGYAARCLYVFPVDGLTAGAATPWSSATPTRRTSRHSPWTCRPCAERKGAASMVTKSSSSRE
jgi:hypothetical protein